MIASVLSVLALLATSAAPDTAVYPLRETVVFGSRINASELRAPAAVSVRRADAFANTRHLSLADALGDLPGVFVQNRAGAQDVRVTIRGYGARGSGERSNVGNMRGIRVLTDGIPVTEPDGRTSLDLVDLGSADRIEIIRSNASALYGNAAGGVVNLRTNLDFEKPWFQYAERAGSFGYHREQALVGFTLGAGRGMFSLLNSTFGGWRAHSSSVATLANLRLALPLDPHTRLGLLVDAVSNLNRFPGGLTPVQYAADPTLANPSFVTRDDRRRDRVGRFAATLEREHADGQNLSAALWVEPKVLQRSERNRFREFNRYHVGGNAVWSRQWALPEGATTRTTIGADEAYQDGTIMFFALGRGASKSTDIVANKREGANSAGTFVQQSYTQGPWSVQAAARFDDLWYIAEDNTDSTLNSTRRFTHVTPKGTVSYRMADHTLYATLGGGVESPAFNEIDPPPSVTVPTSFNPFLEPMTSTTYELGGRGSFASAWRYDAALYWIDVRNDIVPWGGGSYFYTAGKSRRRGAELALDWQPNATLGVGGSVAASKNQYVSYSSDQGTFDGNDIAGLPAVVFGAHARYRCAGGVTTEVTLNGNGRYFADDRNSIEVMQYGLLNASLGYEHAVGRGVLRVFVAGNNLLDKSYLASAFINPLGAPAAPQVFEPGLPRNLSAGLSLRWQ